MTKKVKLSRKRETPYRKPTKNNLFFGKEKRWLSDTGVISQIVRAEKILLLTHESPDGDAVGSSLALKIALENLGKKVNSYCCDPVPWLFLFLPGANLIQQDFLLGDYDLIIILDCGDLRRTGFSDRIREFSRHKNKIINIDHHPKNDLHKIAKFNLVNYDVSSTSEILYEIICRMRIRITRDIAQCLLCGLYTDTASFKHSNTTSKVLNIASDLMKKGARLKPITDNITHIKNFSALRLWGRAFSRIKFNQKYQFASSVITEEDLCECQADKEDLGGVVNMINSIPGTRAAILLYQIEPGKIKASLRTDNDRVNVSRMASYFDGGGLRKASGFTIDGRLIVKGKKWEIKYK